MAEVLRLCLQQSAIWKTEGGRRQDEWISEVLSVALCFPMATATSAHYFSPHATNWVLLSPEVLPFAETGAGSLLQRGRYVTALFLFHFPRPRRVKHAAPHRKTLKLALLRVVLLICFFFLSLNISVVYLL